MNVVVDQRAYNTRRQCACFIVVVNISSRSKIKPPALLHLYRLKVTKGSRSPPFLTERTLAQLVVATTCPITGFVGLKIPLERLISAHVRQVLNRHFGGGTWIVIS